MCEIFDYLKSEWFNSFKVGVDEGVFDTIFNIGQRESKFLRTYFVKNQQFFESRVGETHGIRVLNLNVRRIRFKVAEINVHLKSLEYPQILCFNET